MDNTTLNNSINYSFIAVPTQLFILLDYRIKLVLTALLQVSSVLANADGWFYYSLDDLKKVCGLKSDKTVRACIETLYRLNIVNVQSRTFDNNIGQRTANYYSINFNEIEKYNEYSVYECLNIEELKIPMLDYTSSDYKTTYTAATSTELETTNDEVILEPTDVQDNFNEEIPSKEIDNAPTASEMANTNKLVKELGVKAEIAKQVEEPKDELAAIFDDEDDVTVAEEPTPIRVNDEIIETASVLPSDFKQIEKRNSVTDAVEVNEDEAVKKKCEDLAQRYVEMLEKHFNDGNGLASDRRNQAIMYFIKQYKLGKISEETKDRLSKKVSDAYWATFDI